MARLYEWYDHLSRDERIALSDLEGRIDWHRSLAKDLSVSKDVLRRKAVQRARNAMNKELRKAAKEKKDA